MDDTENDDDHEMLDSFDSGDVTDEDQITCDMFQVSQSARSTKDFYKIGGKLLGKGSESCVRQAHSKSND